MYNILYNKVGGMEKKENLEGSQSIKERLGSIENHFLKEMRLEVSVPVMLSIPKFSTLF